MAAETLARLVRAGRTRTAPEAGGAVFLGEGPMASLGWGMCPSIRRGSSATLHQSVPDGDALLELADGMTR